MEKKRSESQSNGAVNRAPAEQARAGGDHEIPSQASSPWIVPPPEEKSHAVSRAETDIPSTPGSSNSSRSRGIGASSSPAGGPSLPGLSEAADARFGSASGPRFLHREIPVYPFAARRLGKEGSVLLRLRINAEGGLLGIEVLKTDWQGFADAAVEAVKKSTFIPALKDGHPIQSAAILPVAFKLVKE